MDRDPLNTGPEVGAAQEYVSFRTPVWIVPGYLAVGVFFLYGLFLGLRDPTLFSLKGFVIFSFIAAMTVVLGLIVVRSWLTAFDLTLTPTHLVAVHRIRRYRIELPWANIVRVRKLRRWQGPTVSRIEAADGRAILVEITLTNYPRFLEELKKRAVNCRDFDPYLGELDRYRHRRG